MRAKATRMAEVEKVQKDKALDKAEKDKKLQTSITHYSVS